MKTFEIEVAYALPERQWLRKLTLTSGATVQDALDASDLSSAIEGRDLTTARVGVWSREVSRDAQLKPGDRVEIYLSLIHI